MAGVTSAFMSFSIVFVVVFPFPLFLLFSFKNIIASCYYPSSTVAVSSEVGAPLRCGVLTTLGHPLGWEKASFNSPERGGSSSRQAHRRGNGAFLDWIIVVTVVVV